MASIDSNKVTNVEVQNEKDISSSKVIPTNNDQNPNTSTIAKVDEETVVSSDLFAFNPALYSFCKENSIVKTLKVGDMGTLEFQEEIRNGLYGITLWPQSADADYDKLLELLGSVIPEATQWSNRRPNIGELVFGKKILGDWIRGYIVSILPHLRIAMMDEARLVLVNELATCVQPLSDLYAFCGICELSDATHKFKEGEVFEFIVTGQTDNEEQYEFELLVCRRELELKATVKPWIPMEEQFGVKVTELTSGTKVCVTAYQNHMLLYIRPIDAQGTERFKYIMDTVTKCAETSPFLKEPPALGAMVLAQSNDGNYYRATFAKLNDEGKALVMFHDFGRREYVDPKQFKFYPDWLKEIGYTIVKARLRDIPKDIPPIQSIIDVLDNLVETGVPLLCTFNCIPTTEGVYLKYPDGETVNNAIRKCIKLPPREAAE